MKNNTYDVAIIGGGHNGLTTACYLAKAGLKVVVVEKHEYVGGAAVSRELHPGWTYSNCSYVCSLLRPEIFRDLELSKFGLQIIPYEGSATMLDDGRFYAHYNDHDLTYRSIAQFSKRDAEAYDRFGRDVMRQCKIIKPLLKMTPPDPTSFAPKDIMGLFEFAKYFVAKDELGGLGEKEIYDTIRFWTMSVRDYLEEYFESDIVKVHLAGSAIIGTALGPYSPGSAYVLLHHYMGEVDGTVGAWGYSRGGMGSITKAMASSFKSNNGEIIAGSPVTKILIKNNKSYGLVLENGDEIYADKIVSSGAITLDRSSKKVKVGLGYNSVLQTMRIEGGSAEGTGQGKVKRISKVVLRLFNTVGAKCGPSLTNLETVPFRTTSSDLDTPVSTLLAGDKTVEFTDDYNSDGFIFVKQDQPLPCSVLAIYPTLVTSDG